MSDPSTIPGAEMVLKMLYLKETHPHGEEYFGNENLMINLSTYSWDEATKKHSWDGPEHWSVGLNCSDMFFWASGDSEDVTDETYPVLLQVLEDVEPTYQKMAALDKEASERNSAVVSAAYQAYQDAHPDRSDRRYFDQYGNPHGTEDSYKVPEQEKQAQRYSMDSVVAVLFAARVRKMRPQGAAYSYFPKETWPFFNDAGPERETGLGNPSKPGEYSRGPFVEHNKEG